MLKILIADDERWIRLGLIKMLDIEEIGQKIDVIEADSVAKAFTLFCEMKPDIVISDVKFPVSDGCQLCQQIHEIDKNVKLLMVSGYDDFIYLKKSLAYKAVDYLLKPVCAKDLNKAIKKCINEFSNDKNEIYFENINAVIKDLKQYIQNNVEYRHTLSELAQRYHVSEAYLSNAFSKKEEMSLISFITQCKILKAKQLIRTTDYKIIKIALMVGYDDQHYFTRVFRKVEGKSPSEYKKRFI